MFGTAFARALGLVALLAAPVASAGTFEDVMARGTLKVGIVSETFVPYVMIDEDGDPIGFEVDLATRLASDLGVRAEFVRRPLPDLIPTLLAHDADIIISGLSVTMPRAKLGLFSRPYSKSEVNVLARTEDGAAPELASLDADGKTVGVVTGTVSQFVAGQIFQHANVRDFADESALKTALTDGNLDAIVASSPLPELLLATGTDELAMVGDPVTGTVEAMMVRPGETRFLNLVDAWIAEMEAAGFLARRSAYWFDGHDWADRLTNPEVEQAE